MGSVVLRKRPTVDHQQTARSSLDEARQALDVHGASLRRPFLPCHVVGGAESHTLGRRREVARNGVRGKKGRLERERWRKRQGGEGGEVSGGGLPLQQMLRDPWCLSNKTTRRREEIKKKM